MFSKIFKTNMKKLEKLAAVENIAAGDISTEQLSEINAEFVANGLNLEVSAVGELASLRSQIQTLTEAKSKAEADLSTASAKVTSLTTELEAAQKELGSAAAEETKEKAGDLQIESTVDANEALTAKLKAKYGYKN